MKLRLLAIAVLFAIAPSAFAVKNFVLISAPGSGKGTFSQYLVEKYGYMQVCPGDIFRSEIEAQTELGKKIQPIVEKGAFVDEEITCQLIADHLSRIAAQNKPFIIDGFPRSHVSFEFLWNYLKDHNAIDNVCFLQFIASDDLCINRIVGRLICTQCFKVYNVSSAQPKKSAVCDDCNIKLSVRKADTRSIAKNRMEQFHASVEPLMQLASSYYETKTINTERSIQELHAVYDTLIAEQQCI